MAILVWQFLRFFVVGGSSALVQFFVLIVLVESLSINPLVASGLGFFAGALVNYGLNHTFTFNSVSSYRKTLWRFCVNSLFGVLINLLLIRFFLVYYPYLLGQILTSAILLLWNFFVHRYWTFRPK